MTDSSGGDNTDERGKFGKFFYRPSKTKTPEPVVIPGRIDFDEYVMSYPKRGKCYIFNHKVFDPDTNLEVRNGTDVDAARLLCRFKGLGFETHVFQDLKVTEVDEKLREAGKQDHSDSSCFVCCILSHGEYGFLYAKNGIYPTENVFAPFQGDVCPSLVGKPKMFFIQACQGDKLDSGVVCKVGLDSDINFKIPTHADFLVVHSSVPGFYSWRKTTNGLYNGSWFIQALCAAIEEHAKNEDFLSILTIVNRKVELDFESCRFHEPTVHNKKKVPFITSTLTRNVRLI